MKPGKLIARHEHKYFRGWVVATKRRGRRWIRYFSDKPSGRAHALQEAKAYRERLLARLPPPTRLKQKYVSSTTGKIGVALVDERTRTGKSFMRYVATWPTTAGTRKRVSFSLVLYGRTRAKQLAVQARLRGLAELGVLHVRLPRRIR